MSGLVGNSRRHVLSCRGSYVCFTLIFTAGMISSDIDTDTEVDIERVGMKKSDNEDDDDFHDFYQ